jgi:MoaA/NifB/PqqE/SkfB family radical SAM enzyme
VTASLPELTDHIVSASSGASVHDLQLDGTKIGWYRDRVLAWQRGEKIAPITMDVAWTRKCNAACNFCYAQLQSSDGYEITKQNALDFLDDAAAIGVKGVSLISDGESTVVPWFDETIEYGGKLGLQIGMSSNGVRLTKPVLERILPHLTYLRFNFSGGDQKRWAEIMGLQQRDFPRVVQNIKDAMEIKRRDGLAVNINMQMVLMPQDADQIVPLAKLAREIRPDYLIYKHTADNKDGQLGVDYREYSNLHPLFHEVEAMGDEDFRICVKWNRLADDGKRDYQRCYGPPFILQMSGNGLIAPCGFLFNEKYRKFHIGNICTERFRDIFASDRYWEVLNYLASDQFDAQRHCGPNCLQTNTNSWLDKYVCGEVSFPTTPAPPHLAFL